ncbi:MAG: phage major capsid protein [Nitrosomonas sp.]|uniref:phage major capsid protein n=1 Tax=Nitrosomonas sp. TaxID=42353 RepID=UPI0025D66F77|nr:phage major capsid protein [Nitrosomonas sp.]MBY0474210.1 phage major capsid protein [Nitrosomonas sp.]
MDQEQVQQFMKSVEAIESKISAFSEKADNEIKSIGKVSQDTQTAIDNLGIKQRELADDILQLKQRQVLPSDEHGSDGWGSQFTKSDEYTGRLHLLKGNRQFGSIGFEVKNTLTGSDATVAPDRRAGIVPGAYAPLTLESFLQSLPTSSNAIEFTKENVFTNSAAEAAEGAAKAESALTWTLVNMPISTVAHWIKISRQLASDNAALAAYVDTRMRYGVNRKVETQLVSGDGTAPNISGILDTGNFTAHGYADAALGSTLKKLVLIRKIIGDLQAAGDDPDGILLNPADWATIDIDLFTTAAGQSLRTLNEAGQPMLFGKPVIVSVGMTADNVAVGNFAMACTVYNREGVVVEMSDSDSDNFTKNLITLRAERRLALATERPAAIRAGDLTPA